MMDVVKGTCSVECNRGGGCGGGCGGRYGERLGTIEAKNGSNMCPSNYE